MIIDSFRDDYKGKHAFLSNFYGCNGLVVKLPVSGRRIVAPTVEHAYQAVKFLDDGLRVECLQQSTPAAAKKYAQQFKACVRTNWRDISLDVMRTLIERKFGDANPLLVQQLVTTQNTRLIEGNQWHDSFWGCCYCPKCAGRGKNHLGEMLMERRIQVRALLPVVEGLGF